MTGNHQKFKSSDFALMKYLDGVAGGNFAKATVHNVYH